jgi:GTP cyclohydrolase I
MRSGADVPFSVIEESAARDDATTNEDVIDGVCVVRDLHMSTVCEHHLLPFHGTVSVGYALGPDSLRALSRDTLQALVTRHSRRLQVQERLTRDVAEEVSTLTGGVGVMVAARAAHLCMVSRGVEKPGSSTCTVTKLGRFASEPALRSRVWERLASARR